MSHAVSHTTPQFVDAYLEATRDFIQSSYHSTLTSVPVLILQAEHDSIEIKELQYKYHKVCAMRTLKVYKGSFYDLFR